ncbi:MAG: N-acetylneuraminate synthase family protein [Natronomonas sp.]|uniref:N-acetylneuraminate synthase family protein n=1 Tax=Natronomonas sp. TaxID=2184060 RepID=UPI00286FBB4F|nr:N-acetylneuraminate synthase family protein [Natronomonas sp.]MDR9431660.1 N-acetylneuraminate synthase family protein [Natronomonas sp.]
MLTETAEALGSCELIAEAGINHNGDVETAKEMVDVAAEAGVDVVKFQTFDPDEVVTEETEKAEYQKRSASANQHEMLSRVVLTEDEHVELLEHCQARSVEFMSTAYDPESVALLERVGVQRHKVASADIVNRPLLEAITATGKPLILSTGMATLGDIDRAVTLLRETGCPDLTLLHCVSCYPAEPSQVNMRFMETLETAFGVPVGFSDHTVGTALPIMAASRGATAIEKHFTLDRGMNGPDHFASLEPDELVDVVEGVRAVEQAMGDTPRDFSEGERRNVRPMRRSLHLRRDVEAGQTLDRDDLKVVRPFEGIDPWAIDDVVGRSLAIDRSANDPLTWTDLQ